MSHSLATTSARVPTTVHASVSSGSRAPGNISVGISPTQLRLRLDAIRQKTADLPRAASMSPSHGFAEEVLFSSPFSDQQARLHHWWREHLEDKAAMVHAAAPEFSATEEEAPVVFGLPVEVDWVKDRYPARPAYSRF